MTKADLNNQDKALVRMLIYLRHELKSNNYTQESDAVSAIIDSIENKKMEGAGPIDPEPRR